MIKDFIYFVINKIICEDLFKTKVIKMTRFARNISQFISLILKIPKISGPLMWLLFIIGPGF